MDAGKVRESVRVVFQDARLVPGSLEENVRFGNEIAKSDEVEAAMRLADLEPTVASMSSGRITRLGEGGLGLSAGQRQRVAIARAFV